MKSVTWWGVNILSNFQLPISYGLEDSEQNDHLLNELISNKGDCRTALATLGLLSTQKCMITKLLPIQIL